MFKGLKKDVFNIVLFSLATAAMITLDILAVGFSSVYYILIGGLIGIAAYLLSFCREKRKRSETSADGNGNALKDGKDGVLNLADGAQLPAQNNARIASENKTENNAANPAENDADYVCGGSDGVRDKGSKEGKD